MENDTLRTALQRAEQIVSAEYGGPGVPASVIEEWLNDARVALGVCVPDPNQETQK